MSEYQSGIAVRERERRKEKHQRYRHDDLGIDNRQLIYILDDVSGTRFHVVNANRRDRTHYRCDHRAYDRDNNGIQQRVPKFFGRVGEQFFIGIERKPVIEREMRRTRKRKDYHHQYRQIHQGEHQENVPFFGYLFYHRFFCASPLFALFIKKLSISTNTSIIRLITLPIP